jgi:hypothetical protein
MADLVVPCHACGHGNSATEFSCGNPSCQTAIRLQLVTTTQYLPSTSEQDEDRIAMELVRESYLVAALLSQSAFRLLALLQAASAKRKV